MAANGKSGRQDLLFVVRREYDGSIYWVPVEQQYSQGRTVGEAFLYMLSEFLKFLGRLGLRAFVILIIVAFYAAVFVASILVFSLF